MRRKIAAIMCLAFVVIAFAQISNKLTTNTILDLMPRQHSGVRKAPSVNGTKLSAFVKFNDASVIDSIKQLGVKSAQWPATFSRLEFPLMRLTPWQPYKA